MKVNEENAMKKSNSSTMSTVKYVGDLRCESTHIRSGNVIISDAPIDNEGKGEAFSPTDLVATALAKCVLTIMGIKARDRNLDISGATAEVVKVMASGPRRIDSIEIDFIIPNRNLTEHDQEVLEKAGRTCPVAHSLHPDLKQEMNFTFQS